MKKKFFLRLHFAVLVVIFLTASVYLSAQFAGGQGTEEDPWQIATAGHLDNIREYVGEQHGDKYFVQTANINLDVAPFNEGEGWVPIGTQGNRFHGTYYGNYFEIRNLYINRNADYQGLFGATQNSSLQGVIVDVSVVGRRYVGGLAGITAATEISACLVSGNVSGTTEVGGIAGYLAVSQLGKSASMGSVASTDEASYVGGLVGNNVGTTISNSFSRMNVTGNRRTIGGLVGYHQDGQIVNSYATGYIEATHDFPFGTTIGGLVGEIQNATVTGSYWNTETTGQIRTSGGGLGKTTAQMTYPYDENTYVQWDFQDIWVADEESLNNGYPYLFYQTFGEGTVPNLPPPTNLAAYPWDSMVYLEWNIPDYGEADEEGRNGSSRTSRMDETGRDSGNHQRNLLGYYVYRDDNLLTQNPVPAARYYDEDAENGVNYTYHVTAIYSDGESEPSNSVQGRPGPQQFPTASNLKATPGNNKVTLTWEKPNYGLPLVLDTYQVYRDYELISGQQMFTQSFFVDESAVNGDYHNYYVVASYNLGESDASNSVFLMVNPAGWLLVEGEFESYMEMSGGLYPDGAQQASEDDRYWIGVFGPGGINDCRGITRNAEEGENYYQFAHIFGNESETNRVFTIRVHDVLSGNTYGVNETVVFEPYDYANVDLTFNNRFNLTISIEGSGQTQPGTGTRYYLPGQQVDLSATPAAGYTFDRWVINQQAVFQQNTDVIMDGNMNAVAVFTRNSHSLTIQTPGMGTTIPLLGTHPYPYGSIVPVRARPHENHEFVKWTVGEQELFSPIINVTMDRDRVITAHFRAIRVQRIVLDRNVFLITNTAVGASFDINATVYPPNALNRNLIWSTSDEMSATVRPDNFNTALARVDVPVLNERTGVTTIRARTQDGSVSATCQIIVIRSTIDDGPIPDTLSVQNQPFLITRNLNIQGRNRLVIDDGVTLFFSPGTGVNVQGELIANNVTFSGPVAVGRSAWQGLYFGENADNSELNGITVLNALEPIVIESDTLNLSNITIDGSGMTDGNYAIQILGDSSPAIDSLTIENYAGGILIEPAIRRNSIKPKRRENRHSNVNNYRLTTTSLSNIRVRNSSESIRPEAIGLDVKGEVNLILANAEIESYPKGISLQNIEETRALSTVSLTNIRVRNSSESIRETDFGIMITGNILAELENIELEDFSNGIIYHSTYTDRSTATLSNVRVRYSSESVRPSTAGMLLTNIPSLEIEDNELFGYSTGIKIKTDAERRSMTTASLSNVRVRYSSESVRNISTGLTLEGDIDASIDDLEVEDYSVGIQYTNTSSTGTASLTNIRVRYSSESVREPGEIGILLTDMNELFLGDNQENGIEIVGYQKGIEITTSEQIRSMTTATLSNIRVKNSSESVRVEDYGLFVDGSINLNIDQLEVLDYQTGIYQHSTSDFRFSSTSTLSNIRVRNSSESVRNPGIIGLHFVNLDSLFVTGQDNEIIGYHTGVYVYAVEEERRSMTTSSLSNVRVRHSSESVRELTIGFLLEGTVAGDFSGNEIEGYDIGIKIVGVNNSIVKNNTLIDCITGILVRGSEATPVISYNVLELPSLYSISGEASAFVADSSAVPVLNNNTVYMYPTGLIADEAEVIFFNNIIWQDGFDQAVILRNEGTVTATYNNISYVEYPGEGNISETPLFVDGAAGNFNLQAASPCIDAGDPESPLDEDGSRADIGAKPYLRAAEPTFDPPAGAFEGLREVSISCATPGTVIYYTLNGDDPDEMAALFTEPIEIIVTTTIKAKAYFAEAHDWHPSFISEGIYTEASAPQNFEGSVAYDEVLLTWDAPATEGGRTGDIRRSRRLEVRNRLSDQQGISRSFMGYNVYRRKTGEEEFAKVNAAVIDSTSYLDTGLTAGTYFYYVTSSYSDESEFASATISLNVQQVIAPTFEPTPRVFSNSIEVSISCSDEDAVIRYTLNGEEPDGESDIYTTPLNITATTTIKAKAFKEEIVPSVTLTGTYTHLPVPRNLGGEVVAGVVCLDWDAPDLEGRDSNRLTRRTAVSSVRDGGENQPHRTGRVSRNNENSAMRSTASAYRNPTLLGYNVYRNDVKINPSLITEFRVYEDSNARYGEFHNYAVTAVYEEGESYKTTALRIMVIPSDSYSGDLFYNDLENSYQRFFDIYGDGTVIITIDFTPEEGTAETDIVAVYSTNPDILTGFSNPGALGSYFSFTAEEGAVFNGEMTIRIRLLSIPNQLWIRRGKAGSWRIIPDIGAPGAPNYTYEFSIDLDDLRSDVLEIAGDIGGDETLPVELTSFKAFFNAQGFVQLKWVSETETNMLGYRLFRSDVKKIAEASIISPNIIPATNTSATQEYIFTDEDVAVGNTYYYWLEMLELDLTGSFCGPIAVELKEDDEDEGENRWLVNSLIGAYPNPFNISTSLSFSLVNSDKVSINIYNLKGQLIRTLCDRVNYPKGNHSIVWDGTDESGNICTSGIYLYNMQTASGYTSMKKMLLLK